ncbi:MAG: hypothetical protein AAF108_00945 [Planctomycetota bacterium]
MHHSRNANGRDGGGSGRGGNADFPRLVTNDSEPIVFPGSRDMTDDVIEDVEMHLDRTERSLDDLRRMLDPFPGRDDDPPRAA